MVRQVTQTEQLQAEALAYDTTSFYTHIASANQRAQSPQRGHNKQRRHDLRQLGLALVVDQATQLPLPAHQLYEGARSDTETFAAFLQPLRERLQTLAGPSQQLTLVFDAGASSQKNLASLEPGPDYYVTSLRPSYHLALLAEGAEHLAEVTLSSGTTVRAWRSRQRIAGKERDVVVVFSSQLYEGQLRGLHQHAARVSDELQEMGLHPQGTRKLSRGESRRSAAVNIFGPWFVTRSSAVRKAGLKYASGQTSLSIGGSKPATSVCGSW